MQSKGRLELIDFLKGFSIFTIVMYHLIYFYLSTLPSFIRTASLLGGAGVHIFVLCSGFGLFYSHLNNPLTYHNFIKKRFSRIYIPYVTVVLISSLLPFMFSGINRIGAVFSHVFLYKMFVNNYTESFGTQFWFISTIIQFYIAFYGIVWIKQKLHNKLFLIISIFVSLMWGIVITVLGKGNIRIWNSFFLQYLWEFSIGIILAERYYNRKESKKIVLPNKVTLLFISIVGISILGITGIKGGVFKLFNDIPGAFGYASLAIFIYSLNVRILNYAFLFINKISYEWYLVHILIFSCTFQLFEGVIPQLLVAMISFILSILIAFTYNNILRKIRST